MKHFLIFIFWGCFTSLISAQVVISDPYFVTEGNEIEITFYANQGSKGLMDFKGDIYAHTGVITDKSSTDSDWKYTVTSWGVNSPKTKLVKVNDNVFKLSIPNSVRTFYAVPDGEKIIKLAFVFRSAAPIGSSFLEGKDIGGSDILIDVVDDKPAVKLATPANGALIKAGDNVLVKAFSLNTQTLSLFLNDNNIFETDDDEFEFSFTAPLFGKSKLTIKADTPNGEVTDEIWFFIREDVTPASMPLGLRRGVNIHDNYSATFVLFAPYKEYVYLLADFNDWEPVADAQMNKDGDYFWININNLEPNAEYAFQFLIDGVLRIADPYTNKVLDPWNDKYIPNSIYPNLKKYPFDKTDGLVSVFDTYRSKFNWSVNQFSSPANQDLVIYEILIRDFTANGDIKTITDTLDYLVRLGVNAIELMPFNEFEGNDSWGYNPSFYFATDKAYGTANDYKTFINECHKRGIAVIMDMVLNHSFSQSPLLQMYFDAGKAANNNPWYNRENNIKNPGLQWGFPFNHESLHTQALVDSILSFWIDEFKVDGFRFDFTKGFTNKVYNESSWASEYDASRIAILKRMVDKVREQKNDAIIIFEHLADNSEEKVLADYGIMMWGNLNHQFSEAVMGYHTNRRSDFSWGSYKQRNWNEPNLITYMESHDEERVMYKALMYGAEYDDYSVKEIGNTIERKKAAAAFLFAIPGPKMIWQFGELGFDISIDDGGRLGMKPPKWQYLNDHNRAELWEVYASLIHLKKNESVFSTTDFLLNTSAAIKYISLNSNSNDLRLVGNFDLISNIVVPNFSNTGWWYNHFAGDSIFVNNLEQSVSLKAGEFAMFSSKKMTGFMPNEGQNKQGKHQVSVYPVPAKDFIVAESVQNLSKIAVADMQGRIVNYQHTPKNKHVIDVGYLASGVYLLRIVFDDGFVGYKKFVKE